MKKQRTLDRNIFLTTFPNNKIYIGQSNYNNPNYFGSGFKCKRAIEKYGRENLNKTILINNLENQEQLDYWEYFYIKEYNAQNIDIGYNLKDGGSHGLHAEESKIKMSMNKKEFLTEEHKNNISIGINNSEKYKKSIIERGFLISQALMGHFISEESKRKNSKSHQNKKATEETKERQSISMQQSVAKEEKFECEHCHHIVRYCTYVTYHGDKCKKNPKNLRLFICANKDCCKEQYIYKDYNRNYCSKKCANEVNNKVRYSKKAA